MSPLSSDALRLPYDHATAPALSATSPERWIREGADRIRKSSATCAASVQCEDRYPPRTAVRFRDGEGRLGGHEDPVPLRWLTARFVIRRRIVAATRGNGRAAPMADARSDCAMFAGLLGRNADLIHRPLQLRHAARLRWATGDDHIRFLPPCTAGGPR